MVLPHLAFRPGVAQSVPRWQVVPGQCDYNTVQADQFILSIHDSQARLQSTTQTRVRPSYAVETQIKRLVCMVNCGVRARVSTSQCWGGEE